MAMSAINFHVHEEECVSPDFCTKLTNNLQQLYNEQKYCDFTICVENKNYKVHKVVMASVSDYFRAMLEHDVIENQQDCMELKCLTDIGVEPLIKFSYGGSLTLNLGNIHDVMNAATFLQIIPAVDCCVQYLKNKMTFYNAEELLRIADLYSIPHLKSYYRKYILSNFLEFGLTEQFLKLDSDTLADYLNDDSLNTTSECMLLHLVMNWYNYDPETRKDSAKKVFSKIRYVVDGWPAVQFAIQCEPFKTIPALGDLISFADFYLVEYEKRFTFNGPRTRVRYPRKSLVQLGGEIQISYEYREDVMDFPTLFRSDTLGWHRNHYYHPDLKKWLPLREAEIHERLMSRATLTEANGNAILCGGYVYNIAESGIISHLATKEAWIFTASDCRLRAIAPMKHPRAKHTSVFLQGCLYAIGGFDGKQALCSVEKLSGDENEVMWSYARPLSASLHSHAAVVCKNKIYVTGGREGYRITNKTWCFSPKINRWHKKKDMLEERCGHGMTIVNDVIYVLGGTSDDKILESMETYNVETNTWTRICTSIPRPTCYASTVVLDDKILLIGGYKDDENGDDSIEEYDPKEDVWTTLGALVRPMKYQCCCALTLKLTSDGEEETDEIYTKYANIVGGEDEDTLDQELEDFYNLDS
ncbi:kelch-like protein 18 isoform X3 [Ostrea edulis]|uniref:kelch-like protein 18 isoform X3 n=1 Tax=Ostrea edulis TaxID=37623 RepID=UPI0024AED857|nr:kelch-like protein 18 isoform X3 [Ostrea edulis]